MRGLFLVLFSALHLSVFATDTTWANPAGVTWTTGSNWTGGVAPNASGDQATFILDNTYPAVVNIDTGSNITIGTLTIDLTQSTSTNFNIQNNQLGFNVPSGNTSLVVTNPTSTVCSIDSAIHLSKNLDLNLPVRGTAPQDLLLTGQISGARDLTVSGVGTVAFQGVVANLLGNVTVLGGTMLLNNTPGQHVMSGVTLHLIDGAVINQAFGQIASGVHIIIDGGTFDMGGFGQFVSTLTYNGGNLVSGGGTLDFGNPSTALTMRNTTLTATIGTVPAAGTTIRFDASNGGTATINGTFNLESVHL